ncbi:MAG: hypothetical protein IT457_24200 [Planctomycetes bacterium]|nr:hypothetical protein [Planctomycetota bacterium]
MRSSPRPILSRCIPLLLLGACSVFGGLSPEERDQLQFYRQNAGVYFRGDRYEQALDMARKGLELDPEDYHLLVTAALCNLQRAGDDVQGSGSDAQMLQTAEGFFDRAFALRDFEDNAPEAILGYATTKQRLGRDLRRRANVLASELERAELAENDRIRRESQRREFEVRALSYWSEARRALKVLLERQELLRFAHKQLMEISAELNEYEPAVEHGNACLAENRRAQDRANQVIRETMDPGEEIRMRGELQGLLDQEKRVRSALAEMHFRKQEFAAAVEQLDALLALDPTRSADYYNRGRALERLDRRDAARRDYEKFLYTTSLPASDERVAHATRSTQRN